VLSPHSPIAVSIIQLMGLSHWVSAIQWRALTIWPVFLIQQHEHPHNGKIHTGLDFGKGQIYKTNLGCAKLIS
jgi:hypothetical protein